MDSLPEKGIEINNNSIVSKDEIVKIIKIKITLEEDEILNSICNLKDNNLQKLVEDFVKDLIYKKREKDKNIEIAEQLNIGNIKDSIVFEENTKNVVKKLTQSEISRRLDVSQSTVKRRREKKDFPEWSKEKDPESISWKYSQEIKNSYLSNKIDNLLFMAVFIDLDQTLIDSRIAESSRRARDWSSVYKLVPRLSPYPGISNLIMELNNKKVPICIVTSSPTPYCRHIISQWEWKIDATVCYHDTQRRKPFPDPFLAGLAKLKALACNSVAIGDAANDIYAAKAANILSVGASWGTLEKEKLFKSNPDIMCFTTVELKTFLLEYFKSKYL